MSPPTAPVAEGTASGCHAAAEGEREALTAIPLGIADTTHNSSDSASSSEAAGVAVTQHRPKPQNPV